MFEDTQRLLRSLGGAHDVSVSIEDDEEGYFDRECPSEECLFQFKMFSEDWPKAKAADRRHCPACGHTDHSDRWWTGEQIEDAKAAAIAQFKAQFSKALKADAVRFNRSRPRVMVLRSRERPCASGWSRTGFGCRATSGGYFIARGSGANAMAS